MSQYIFTSESVSEGHPDKICDQIADMILDMYLAEDANAKTAVEAVVYKNSVLIFGEINSKYKISSAIIEKAVRELIRKIGYAQTGFHWEKVKITIKLNKQSSDISQGLKNEGAGDQGMMFGYACSETKVYMPAPILFAHKILWDLKHARSSGELSMLGPDAKCQLSLLYRNNTPVKVYALVVSTQHSPDFNAKKIKDIIYPYILKALPDDWMCSDDKFLVNPSGKFVKGGPAADSGLTGRKIIVDTYGGAALHGGGAFSGKDCSKVDRSAAYMARYLAKNLVAANVAKKCTIQLCYAIGKVQPVSVYINSHGTGIIPDDEITRFIEKEVDLSPAGIRKTLNLKRPIYQLTASYGHFGRAPQDNGCFSWEKLDLAREVLLLLNSGEIKAVRR